jgi:hypothetical protein
MLSHESTHRLHAGEEAFDAPRASAEATNVTALLLEVRISNGRSLLGKKSASGYSVQAYMPLDTRLTERLVTKRPSSDNVFSCNL